MEEKAEEEGAASWYRVASSSSLHASGRIHTKIDGRYVSVFRIGEQLYAIDSICYRAGGPLAEGDIEDIDGHLCLRCPWHRYNVTIASGQLVYEGVTFEQGMFRPTGWKVGKKTQRTHAVAEVHGYIYVQVSTEGERLSSDEFAVSTRKQRFDLCLHNEEPVRVSGPGGHPV